MRLLDRLLRRPDPDLVVNSSLKSMDLANILLRKSGVSEWDEDRRALNYEHRAALLEQDVQRRAVSSLSNLYSTNGIYRQGFDRWAVDSLAANPYFSLGETRLYTILRSMDFQVTDLKTRRHVSTAERFCLEPNPDWSLTDIFVKGARDNVRYDQGIFINSFNRAGYLAEFDAFYGPEFWKELDREAVLSGYPIGAGSASHGYTTRTWQHAQNGIYQAFQPKEVTWWIRFPKANDVYGTDSIMQLRMLLKFLIEGTRATGKALENGMLPSMAIKHPGVQTQQQLSQRMAETKLQNQGAWRAGSVLHLIGQEDLVNLSHTLADMQWLESQQFIGQLVWSFLGFSLSEFMETGASGRSGQHVQLEKTKNRLVKPLLMDLERIMNLKVLPHLRGYRKSWRFSFVNTGDLDDQLKEATIQSTRFGSAINLKNAGMPWGPACTMAGCGDDVRTFVKEEFSTQAIDLQSRQIDSGTTGPVQNGQPRPAAPKAQAPYKGPNPIQKSRIYTNDPGAVPKDAVLVPGTKGGHYYDSASRHPTGKDEEGTDLGPRQASASPERLSLEGEEVDVWMLFRADTGKIEGYHDSNVASKEIAHELRTRVYAKGDPQDPNSWVDHAQQLATEQDLRVNL